MIEGVKIKKLRVIPDERGRLMEILRSDDALFERCIELLLMDDGVDCLFISIVPHTVMLHTKREEMEKDRENIAYRINRRAGNRKSRSWCRSMRGRCTTSSWKRWKRAACPSSPPPSGPCPR